MGVTNLNAKEKKSSFFDQQQSEQNYSAEQSNKLQLYIYEKHSYKTSLLIRDRDTFFCKLTNKGGGPYLPKIRWQQVKPKVIVKFNKHLFTPTKRTKSKLIRHGLT